MTESLTELLRQNKFKIRTFEEELKYFNEVLEIIQKPERLVFSNSFPAFRRKYVSTHSRKCEEVFSVIPYVSFQKQYFITGAYSDVYKVESTERDLKELLNLLVKIFRGILFYLGYLKRVKNSRDLKYIEKESCSVFKFFKYASFYYPELILSQIEVIESMDPFCCVCEEIRTDQCWIFKRRSFVFLRPRIRRRCRKVMLRMHGNGFPPHQHPKSQWKFVPTSLMTLISPSPSSYYFHTDPKSTKKKRKREKLKRKDLRIHEENPHVWSSSKLCLWFDRFMKIHSDVKDFDEYERIQFIVNQTNEEEKMIQTKKISSSLDVPSLFLHLS